MTKNDLIVQVAEATNSTKKATGEVITAIIDTITDALVKGDEVALTGFGKFCVVERAARVGVNPQNPSEKIKIPATKSPKFKASSTLKTAVKEAI